MTGQKMPNVAVKTATARNTPTPVCTIKVQENATSNEDGTTDEETDELAYDMAGVKWYKEPPSAA